MGPRPGPVGIEQPDRSSLVDRRGPVDLAKLREEGLVATRKEAQTVFYRVSDPKAGRLLAVLHDLFCPDLGRVPAAND